MSAIPVSGGSRTLFLTPQYVRENSVLNDNTDGKLIVKAIRTAEDKYIMPIIGGNLYYKLIQLIKANTLTGDYQNLMNQFIVPCLLEYSVYEYVPYSFKFRNKGISKQTSPDSEAADLDELFYLRDNILQSAQFYGENLIKYLKVNGNLFPEYSTWTADQIAPAKGDYFGGIHIPNSNRGNCGDFGMGLSYPVNV